MTNKRTTRITRALRSTETLVEAVDDLGRILGDAFDTDLWQHFTCIEFEALRTVLVLGGWESTADLLVQAHGAGDEEDDDLHHYVYAGLAKCGALTGSGPCALPLGHWQTYHQPATVVEGGRA